MRRMETPRTRRAPRTRICSKTNKVLRGQSKKKPKKKRPDRRSRPRRHTAMEHKVSPSPGDSTLTQRQPVGAIFHLNTYSWTSHDRLDGGLKSYRSRGARSLQCFHPEWFSRSGPQAGSGARCADQTMTCCSEFPTPPSRCHSSCAGRRPAGPARGWRWRRSLADGGAKEKKKKKAERTTK